MRLAIARKRLAAMAERRTASKRLGFGAVVPVRPPLTTRSPPMSEVAARRPIERRLSDAGPAAAAADSVARDRPRRAGGQPGAAARPRGARHPRPARGQGRRLRPRCRSGRARPRGERGGRVLRRRHRRGARAPRRRRARADPRALPGPGGLGRRGGAARDLGRRRRPRGRWPRPRGPRQRSPQDGRSASISRSRRVSGGAGCPARTSSAAARLVADAPGLVLAGLWTHFQAVEDEAGTAAQVARFDAAAAEIAAAGVVLPARHVAASAALMTDEVVAYDGVRPGLAVYGLVPDELEGVADVVPAASRFRPVMSMVARAVRVADLPAGAGISYGPTFRTARPSRIATLPVRLRRWLVARAVEPGERAGPRPAGAARRQRRDGRRHGRRHRCPGATGRPRPTNSCSSGGPARSASASRTLARLRTTNSWEVVTDMSRRLPRVYHAAAGPVGLRTLTERKG